MSSLSLQKLFDAKVHLGHLLRFRQPKMSSYLYDISPVLQTPHYRGTRKKDRYEIIDLEKTRSCLDAALAFVTNLSKSAGSKILFVGTKRAAQSIIQEQATRAMMPYVNCRWLGGMLTNYSTIRQSVKQLKELELINQDIDASKLTKKELLKKQHVLSKLKRSVGGIEEMSGLPDALFVIDIGYEHIAVSEAQKLGIPIIGVVDTNNSPRGIDYVIPGNDDSTSAIELYVTAVADAVLEGRAQAHTTDTTAAPEPVIKKTKKPLIEID